jgi:hypothetical protein
MGNTFLTLIVVILLLVETIVYRSDTNKHISIVPSTDYPKVSEVGFCNVSKYKKDNGYGDNVLFIAEIPKGADSLKEWVTVNIVDNCDTVNNIVLKCSTVSTELGCHVIDNGLIH